MTHLALLLSWLLAAVDPSSVAVVVAPPEPSQGQLLLIEVTGAQAAEQLSGVFSGRPLRFFEDAKGRMRALASVELTQKPGLVQLQVTLRSPGASPVIKGMAVKVRPGEFGSQNLKVDSKFLEPPKEVLARIDREQKAFAKVYQAKATPRQWRGNFAWPSQDQVSSAFGLKRLFNGRNPSRHWGLDINGETGDPIKAIGAGTVVLVNDCYYSGGTVVIDHGLHLFSLYFHMSKFDVKVGEQVVQGQIVGQVGASGRVTGSHLHLSTRLEDVLFDPTGLLNWNFDDQPGEPETKQ